MEATQIVHWPGRDTAACDAHTAKLKVLASMLIGFVSTTPCEAGVECDNCKNESAKEK